MKRIAVAALAVGAIVYIQPLLAHHGGTEFSDEITEISGTVKEFQFQNPHSWIQVEVPDAKGKVVEWSVEWGSPNQLAREGYRPSTFPRGAKVTLKIHPMRSGAPAGGFVAAKLGDGTIVGKWTGGPNP
jgi:hypothetical protein